ncbi:MAG: hypothetical protein VB862_07755 [Pirellulaceae bacterium]
MNRKVKAEMKWDILIRGGEVVDPSQQLQAIKDVAVQGGKIAEIGDDLPADQDRPARRKKRLKQFR